MCFHIDWFRDAEVKHPAKTSILLADSGKKIFYRVYNKKMCNKGEAVAFILSTFLAFNILGNNFGAELTNFERGNDKVL